MGAVRGAVDQGEFELLDVCEGHVLLKGVVAVVDPTSMHLGLGDFLLHHPEKI